MATTKNITTNGSYNDIAMENNVWVIDENLDNVDIDDVSYFSYAETEEELRHGSDVYVVKNLNNSGVTITDWNQYRETRVDAPANSVTYWDGEKNVAVEGAYATANVIQYYVNAGPGKSGYKTLDGYTLTKNGIVDGENHPLTSYYFSDVDVTLTFEQMKNSNFKYNDGAGPNFYDSGDTPLEGYHEYNPHEAITTTNYDLNTPDDTLYIQNVTGDFTVYFDVVSSEQKYWEDENSWGYDGIHNSLVITADNANVGISDWTAPEGSVVLNNFQVDAHPICPVNDGIIEKIRIGDKIINQASFATAITTIRSWLDTKFEESGYDNIYYNTRQVLDSDNETAKAELKALYKSLVTTSDPGLTDQYSASELTFTKDGDDLVISHGTDSERKEGFFADSKNTTVTTFNSESGIYEINELADMDIVYNLDHGCGTVHITLGDLQYNTVLNFGVEDDPYYTATVNLNDGSLLIKRDTDKIYIDDYFSGEDHDKGRGRVFYESSSKERMALEDTIGAEDIPGPWFMVAETKNITGEYTGSFLNETLKGKSDVDKTINGGEGNDWIWGRNGNDILSGDAGDDVLQGGQGNDTMTGGTGNDNFDYTRSELISAAGIGHDVITDGTRDDYIRLENDGIDIADYTYTRSGNNLIINLDEDNSITLQDHFTKYASDNQLDTIKTGLASSGPVVNQSILEKATINVTVGAGETYTPTAYTEALTMGEDASILLPVDTKLEYDQNGRDLVIKRSGLGDDIIKNFFDADGNVALTSIGYKYTEEGTITTFDSEMSSGDIEIVIDNSQAETPQEVIDNSDLNKDVKASDKGDSITMTGSGDNTITTGASENPEVVTTVNATGSGDNTIYLNKGTDNITVGNGDNTIAMAKVDEQTTVTDALNKTIVAGTGSNTITADLKDTAKADITITGAEGKLQQVTVEGGTGNTITVQNGNSSIATGSGSHTIDTTASSGKTTVNTTTGDNNISTGSGNDTIYTGKGVDVVNAGAGDDTIIVRANSTKNTITGGAGADTFRFTSDVIPNNATPSLMMMFSPQPSAAVTEILDASSIDNIDLPVAWENVDIDRTAMEFTTAGKSALMNDLIISYNEGMNVVLIKDFFQVNYPVDKIVTTDTTAEAPHSIKSEGIINVTIPENGTYEALPLYKENITVAGGKQATVTGLVIGKDAVYVEDSILTRTNNSSDLVLKNGTTQLTIDDFFNMGMGLNVNGNDTDADTEIHVTLDGVDITYTPSNYTDLISGTGSVSNLGANDKIVTRGETVEYLRENNGGLIVWSSNGALKTDNITVTDFNWDGEHNIKVNDGTTEGMTVNVEANQDYTATSYKENITATGNITITGIDKVNDTLTIGNEIADKTFKRTAGSNNLLIDGTFDVTLTDYFLTIDSSDVTVDGHSLADMSLNVALNTENAYEGTRYEEIFTGSGSVSGLGENDKIAFAEETVTSYTFDASGLHITGGTNTITITDNTAGAFANVFVGEEPDDISEKTLTVTERTNFDGSALGYGSLEITGTDSADNLIGGANADTITGGEGDDTITGGAGNDIITGGKGDDILNGGDGENKFYFADGDGADTITANATDTIYLASEPVKAVKDGNTVKITYAEGDTITINNYASVSTGAIDTIHYGEGYGQTYKISDNLAIEIDADSSDLVFTRDGNSLVISSASESFADKTYENFFDGSGAGTANFDKIYTTDHQEGYSIKANATINVELANGQTYAALTDYAEKLTLADGANYADVSSLKDNDTLVLNGETTFRYQYIVGRINNPPFATLQVRGEDHNFFRVTDYFERTTGHSYGFNVIEKVGAEELSVDFSEKTLEVYDVRGNMLATGTGQTDSIKDKYYIFNYTDNEKHNFKNIEVPEYTDSGAKYGGSIYGTAGDDILTSQNNYNTTLKGYEGKDTYRYILGAYSNTKSIGTDAIVDPTADDKIIITPYTWNSLEGKNVHYIDFDNLEFNRDGENLENLVIKINYPEGWLDNASDSSIKLKNFFTDYAANPLDMIEITKPTAFDFYAKEGSSWTTPDENRLYINAEGDVKKYSELTPETIEGYSVVTDVSQLADSEYKNSYFATNPVMTTEEKEILRDATINVAVADGVNYAATNYKEVITLAGDSTVTGLGADDKIRFAGKENFEGMTFAKGLGEDVNDLVITNGEKTVTIKDYFTETGAITNKFILGGEEGDKEYILEWKESNAFDHEGMYRVVENASDVVAGIPNWVNSGEGNDEITGANTYDMLAGNGGDDTITTAISKSEIYGGAGDDVISATGGESWIWGNEGKDSITLSGGKNTVILIDTFEGDTIEGATSTDRLAFYANMGRGGFEGHSIANMEFSQVDNDLQIKDGDSTMLIKGYFTAENVVADNAPTEFYVKEGHLHLEWKQSSATGEYHMYNVTTDIAKLVTGAETNGVKNWINSGAADDTFSAINSGDMIAANGGNNTITAVAGAEVYAENGNDTITAAGGNFIGVNGVTGEGHDTINLANTGNNTVWVFNDTADADAKFNIEINGATSTDKLKFNKGTIGGYNFSDLAFNKSGNDLVISIGEEGAKGTVTVKGYFDEGADRVKTFQTLDGTYTLGWHTSNATGHEGMYLEQTGVDAEGKAIAIEGIPNWINSGAGNDKVYGMNEHDMLAGNAGDNDIYAVKGAEVYGENDSDYVYAKGNNFIWTHGGNDVINLEGGNNTIMFADDFGSTTIMNATSTDVLKFTKGAEGISIKDLKFSQFGSNLIIEIDGKDNAEIVVNSYFDEEGEPKANVPTKFITTEGELTLGWHTSNATGYHGMYLEQTGVDEEGKATSIEGIPNWINSGAGDDTVIGANDHDMLAGNAGDNTITAVKGAEVYAENGNDTINAKGDNFIWTHGGNDTINLAGGNNTVAFYDADAAINATVIGATSSDKLKFNIGDEGHTFEDMEFSKGGEENKDLIISLGNAGKVTVQGYFDATDKVNTFIVGGEEYTLGWHSSNAVDYEGMYLEQTNTGSVQAIAGIPNWINSGAEDDTVIGANNHDMLAGNAGDNTITAVKGAEVYAENGNDTINAKGDNFIWTHGGNDTINLAGGNNTVAFYDADAAINATVIGATSSDKLKFNIGDEGHNFADMKFSKGGEEDKDLIISLGEEGAKGTVTVKGYFDATDKVNTFIVGGKEYTLGWHTSSATGHEGMYLEQTGLGDTTAVAGIPNWINSGAGNDNVIGKNDNDMLAGNGGNNVINPAGNSEVYGENGNDIVNVTAGGNFIGVNGATEGQDQINLNESGNNTIWVFNDTENADAKFDMVISGATATDKLKFNKGTLGGSSLGDMTFTRDEEDLVISLGEKGKVTIQGYFDEEGEPKANVPTEFITLEDGAVKTSTLEWKASNALDHEGMYRVVENSTDVIKGIPNWVNSGEGNDEITGKNEYDMLAGNGGNDTINASTVTGDVEIYGGAGVDTLTGGAGNDWIAGNEGDDIINGGKGDDYLFGGDWTGTADPEGKDEIHGGAGDDKIYGRGGDDFLYGDEGDDYIAGGAGDDKITGGAGDDTIKTGAGNNTVFFNTADFGKDIIDTTGSDSEEFDFTGSGYTLSDIENATYTAYGNDLQVTLKENEDDEAVTSFTIKNYLKDGLVDPVIAEKITIIGSDGEKKTLAKIDPAIDIDGKYVRDQWGNIYGTANSDLMNGDKIKKASNAAGYGSRFYGQDGNDVIISGKGNDTIYGGKGNDKFVFDIGDGNDYIVNEGKEKGNDTLIFHGINEDTHFVVKERGADLVVEYGNKGDTVVIQGGLTENHSVKEIISVDDDGNKATITIPDDYTTTPTTTPFLEMDVEDYGNYYVGGSKYSEKIVGSSSNNYLAGGGGNDVIYANAGTNTILAQSRKGDNVTVVSGSGDDYMTAGLGTDTFKQEDRHGNDTIYANNQGTVVIDLTKITNQKDISFVNQGMNLKINDQYGITGSDGTIIRDESTNVVNYLYENYLDSHVEVKYRWGANTTDANTVSLKDYITIKQMGWDNENPSAKPEHFTLNASTGNYDIVTDAIDPSVLNYNAYVLGNKDLAWGQGVNGSYLNERLQGGSGNDYINTGKGVDIVNAGDGNDTLVGNTEYIWNAGGHQYHDKANAKTFTFDFKINKDDSKTVTGFGSGNDYVYNAKEADRIQIVGSADDVTELYNAIKGNPSSISAKIEKVGNNLVIRYGEHQEQHGWWTETKTDSITIVDFYGTGSGNSLDKLEFVNELTGKAVKTINLSADLYTTEYNDYYKISDPATGTTTVNEHNGHDTYVVDAKSGNITINDDAKGSTATWYNGYGYDNYQINGVGTKDSTTGVITQATVTINDTGNGNDRYSIYNSGYKQAVITDTDGHDSYVVNGTNIAADTKITDSGKGNDYYGVTNYNLDNTDKVTKTDITDDGGYNTFAFYGGGNGSVLSKSDIDINSTGTLRDNYVVSGNFRDDEINITDNGGDNSYGIYGSGGYYWNGSASVVKKAESDVVIQSGEGNDYYNFSGNYRNDNIQVTDNGGNNTFVFSSYGDGNKPENKTTQNITVASGEGNDNYQVYGNYREGNITITDNGSTGTYDWEANKYTLSGSYNTNATTINSTDEDSKDNYYVYGNYNTGNTTINDAGGKNNYVLSGNYTDNVTINAIGNGNDTYSIYGYNRNNANGTGDTIDDKGGNNTFNIYSTGNSKTSIKAGDGADTYNLSSISGGAKTEINDLGGSDEIVLYDQNRYTMALMKDWKAEGDELASEDLFIGGRWSKGMAKVVNNAVENIKAGGENFNQTAIDAETAKLKGAVQDWLNANSDNFGSVSEVFEKGEQGDITSLMQYINTNAPYQA